MNQKMHNLECRENACMLGKPFLSFLLYRERLKSKSLTHLDGLGTETVCNHAKNNANSTRVAFNCIDDDIPLIASNDALLTPVFESQRYAQINAVITTTLNTNYTLSASLSPPLPQYHMKRSLSPVRFSSQHHHHISNHNHNHNHHHHHHHNHYQRRTYSSQKVANRLSPIIYTQAPQQPSSKSLVSNLSLYSTYKTTSSCTTTTTAACYNSRICSSHTSSSNKSSCSNLHLSSHQHYHANKFQSDASSLTTISSAKPTSNTLKSLPIADNSNNIAKLCNASGDECGGNVGGSAVALPISSSAASLYPPGSSVTPINYKQKSFMQRKKPMLTRSEKNSHTINNFKESTRITLGIISGLSRATYLKDGYTLRLQEDLT
ncbi:hypothetical protein GQX74_004095 [Glossina fuscipes]|nr:hypothetical protein GQX74_004095 [Glossina fuscipes]